MSLSSPREEAGRWRRRGWDSGEAGSLAPLRPGHRAQTEPIAALVAVFAVCVGLSLYAGVAPSAPVGPERSSATPTAEAVASEVTHDGVVDPDAITSPDALTPNGTQARLTVSWTGGRRTVGPAPPGVDPRANGSEASGGVGPRERTESAGSAVDRTSRPVTVRVAPGDQRPGRLTVEVWR